MNKEEGIEKISRRDGVVSFGDRKERYLAQSYIVLRSSKISSKCISIIYIYNPDMLSHGFP